jgi:hypothetical protein
LAFANATVIAHELRRGLLDSGVVWRWFVRAGR